jgi:hypothetical protein
MWLWGTILVAVVAAVVIVVDRRVSEQQKSQWSGPFSGGGDGRG